MHRVDEQYMSDLAGYYRIRNDYFMLSLLRQYVWSNILCDSKHPSATVKVIVVRGQCFNFVVPVAFLENHKCIHQEILHQGWSE